MTAPVAPSETARCDMCVWPPSLTGPILPVGPGGKNVDMGHEDCFRAASQDARTEARAS